MQFDEKFKDPKTGETVTRVKVPEKYVPDIEKHVNENGLHANNFMQISKNLAALSIKQIEEFKAANESEQNIGKQVIIIREKMGLDSGWIYNIPMKMMEKREPPEEEGMMGRG